MNNRSRRTLNNMLQQKPFVSGGVYDSRQQFIQRSNAPPPPPIIHNDSVKEDITKYINPEPPVVQQKQQHEQMLLLEEQNHLQQQQSNKIEVVTNLNNQQQLKKIETFTNNSTDAGNDDVAADGADGDGKERKGYFKKVFGFRKKPSIRAKEKKIRQNRRLRKVLLPKNALMALHEVKNIKIEDFVISNNLTSGGFTATVSVNNVQYEGSGNSKNAAKNSACEKALRDLVIMKMNQKPYKSKTDKMDEGESNTGGTTVADEDVHMKDVDEQEDDEIPMLNLASFALFKLFSEWEAAGFEVPEFRPTGTAINTNGNNSDGGGSLIDKPKKQPAIRSELPPNWETMHPATLLCMMRPGITYTEEGCEGQPPNVIQKMGVTIDNEHFIGHGRSKKIARKNAAVNACNKLYGANFIKFEN